MATVKVSWVFPVASEPEISNFRVKWGTEPGNYTNTASPANKTLREHNVGGLALGTTYYFVVVTIDGNGNESPISNEVAHTPALPGPSGLSAAQASPNSVNLTWNFDVAKEGQINGYRIKWGQVAGGPYPSEKNLSYSSLRSDAIGGLVPGVTYYFVVHAKDGNANLSAPSNEADATLNLPGVTGVTVVDV